MATVKLGALISDIRGSAGGIVFSKNTGGNYVRLWKQPSKTKTVLRVAQRATWTGIPQMWRNLSSAIKADWITFAALPAQELTNSMGEAYYASGYNWFVKCNSRLLAAGEATISAAPTTARPAAPTISTITFEQDVGLDAELTITYPNNEFDGLTLIAQCGFNPRGGLTVWATKLTMLQRQTAAGATSEDFSTQFDDLFGQAVAGDQIFLFVSRQTDEGIRSAPTEISEFYTA